MSQTIPMPMWDIVEAHMEAHRQFIGRQAIIPIRLSPEARARRDWDEAVKSIERRRALKEEWAFPW